MNAILLFGLLLLGPGGAEDYGIQIPSAVSPAGQLNYGTIAADDTHPSVKGKVVWTTSANTGATAITDLDDVVAHKWIILIGGSNTNPSTIADSGNFNLDQSKGAMTLSLDAGIMLYAQQDNDYIEISRWDDTALDDLTIATLTVNNTGLHILDTNASHDLIIVPGSDLTSDRQFTITTGDAARTLTMSADLTVESTSTVNQDLTTDASVSFEHVASTDDAAITHQLTVKQINMTPVCTIADGDATPSVADCGMAVTSSNTAPTAITDLDNPVVGQLITICGGSNTNSSTIADAGNFALDQAFTASLDLCLTLYVQADNDYVEVSRTKGFAGDLLGADLSDSTDSIVTILGSIVQGSATADTGTFTMIKGAQTGDPQVQMALTSDGVGGFSITTSGGTNGDITLSPSGGEVHVGADDSAKNVEIHSGGTFKMWDASDDTSVTLDVDNGTAELDLTGDLSVSSDVDVGDTLTCGDLVVDEAAGTIAFTGATSATISTTTAGLTLSPKTALGVWPQAITGDTHPAHSVISAQSAAWNASTAANKLGAPLVLAGGVGQRLLTVSNAANMAADTLSFAVSQSGVAVTWAIVEGTDFDCAALTTLQCACNIYTDINAHTATSGLTAQRTDGTCSDSKVWVLPVPGVSSAIEITYTSGGSVGLTYTRSEDGGILSAGPGTASAPAIGFSSDPDTGIYSYAANYLGFAVGGSSVANLSATNFTLPAITVTATSAIKFGTTRALSTSPADGQWTFKNAGSSSGATLDVDDENGWFVIKDMAGTGAGYLSVSAYNLTAATGGATGNATLTQNGSVNVATSKMAFTHAAFDTACDTIKTCDFKMGTLPARTVVRRALFVVDLAETHLSDLTVSCGRTGAAYIDWVVASNAKSQTVYGDATAEIGAGLAPLDIPSTSGTTDVYCQFITTDGSHDLGDSEAFVGWLVLETSLLP